MAPAEAVDSLSRQVVRFLVVGGLNTLITYAIFIALGLIIPPWLAYAIAFAVGLAWVTFGSSRIVFRAQTRFLSLALFCAWYLMVFGVGQLIIRLVDPQDFPGLLLASAIVLVFTTPLTFLGGKLLFTPQGSHPSASESRDL